MEKKCTKWNSQGSFYLEMVFILQVKVDKYVEKDFNYKLGAHIHKSNFCGCLHFRCHLHFRKIAIDDPKSINFTESEKKTCLAPN